MSQIDADQQGVVDEIIEEIKIATNKLNRISSFNRSAVNLMNEIEDVELENIKRKISVVNQGLATFEENSERKTVNAKIELIDFNSGVVSPQELAQGRETLEAINDFLQSLEQNYQELQRRSKNVTSELKTYLSQIIDIDAAAVYRSKLDQLKRDVDIAKSTYEEAKKNRIAQESIDGNSRYGFSSSRTLVTFENERLKEFNEAKANLDRHMGTAVKVIDLNSQALNMILEKYLTAARKYREDSMQSLKTIQDVGDVTIMPRARASAENYFSKLNVPEALLGDKSASKFIANYSKIATRQSWADTQKSALDRIKEAVADSEEELLLSVSSIHREILNKIRKTGNAQGALKIGKQYVVYILKAFRAISSVFALGLANKFFFEFYKQKSKSAAAEGAKEPKVLDLKWFVAIYITLQILFDAILVLAMWIVGKLDPDFSSGGLLLDYMFDALIITLMVAASTFWIADVLQDMRYFSYRTNAPRAIRILKSLMQWIILINTAIPYFDLIGPRFLKKEIDSNKEEAKEAVKTKIKGEAN